MRIGFVTDNYPATGGAGGIGTYTQIVGDQLALLGHEVHVFTFADIDEVQTIGRVTVHMQRPWAQRREMSLRQAAAFTWSHMNDATRLNGYQMHEALRAAGRFDLVEVPEFAGIGRWIVGDRKVAARVAVRLHGSRNQGVPGWRALPSDAELDTVRGADVVTAPTAAVVRLATEMYGITIDATVVPNPVQWRPPSRAPGGPDVFYMGRLEHRKGVDVLASALARLPDVAATFAGLNQPWDDQRQASEVITATGANVTFLGVIPHADVLALASAARVVAVPSRQESFGLTLVEAMMAGAPVVASDIPVFRELTGNGQVAALVPLEPAPLADAIRRLLDDVSAADQLGAAGYQHAQQFRAESVVERLLAAWSLTGSPTVGRLPFG